ncbi:mannose-1-phosphate guanylyltransferase / mannose-6-phosphate isomerase [Enhydrobacter aerosaccus]|uniref:mannose-1-phosphate guanylyltransferase n=1 Tax=Enhydrobacter aerosaccus TaxID=225324 RepID=A0A1T4KIK1_9HYPH|nr:mannose-1-phosphate guanylyltransferase/mannose-6-phosphate isomerase [Enhydrobacter aerosaccus]SJZ42206.1 mannose-1-phosphate guanylyltransferase / mannose-6-phosphate isomerase [Enhydrobacter aerosaccus]
MTALITPIILVGGSGKRLWPLSRESMPKQFVPLLGERSTFQQTLLRVGDKSLFGRPVIATNENYRFMAEQQARELGIEIDLLIEPSRRDSGPAIGAAAAYAKSLGTEAVLALASDHLIIGEEEFRAGCRDGLAAVRQGGIVTFGIPPTEPKTDYGYIRLGSEKIGDVRKVAAFVEKPDAQTALRYISEGLLWNSGNFLFSPALLLAEMARFEPAMATAVEEAVAKARRDGATVFLNADAFAQAPAKSIDYAVMERTDKCWVVPARFSWSDLGTWGAMLDVGTADSAGNVTEGPVELDQVRNSYVRSDGPLTAVIGVENLVVVAMHDAVLVGHHDDLPRLKDVVQRMSDRNHKAATEYARMHRSWGSAEDIGRGLHFRVRRLTMKAGERLVLQSHRRRDKHWFVVNGVGEVLLDGKTRTLAVNDSILIPRNGIHSLRNPGSEMLEFIEIQTGEHLDEEDFVRHEDSLQRPQAAV